MAEHSYKVRVCTEVEFPGANGQPTPPPPGNDNGNGNGNGADNGNGATPSAAVTRARK